jgi:hypothetical protein
VYIRIERGETIKERDQGGGLGSLVRSVADCEGGGKDEWLSGEERVWRRRGSEEGETGRRVRDVQTKTPRSGFTDPRRKVRGEPNAGVQSPHSTFHRPDFVVHRGPEEVRKSPRNVQVARDVDRPVTIKAR